MMSHESDEMPEVIKARPVANEFLLAFRWAFAHRDDDRRKIFRERVRVVSTVTNSRA